MFLAGLACVAGAAAVIGTSVPSLREDAATGTAHDDGDEHAAAAAAVPSDDGTVRLALDTTTVTTGRTSLAFTVLDRAGHPVRRYDTVHERDMHVIVASLDLATFRHVHPVLGADGRWRVTVGLPESGAYRVFADFSTGGDAHVLAADMIAGGVTHAHDHVLPAPAAEAAAPGGYRVTLAADTPDGGAVTTLRYAVTRGGAPVTGIVPYLGAAGHVVALREGDLGYAHVHPVTRTADGGRLEFQAHMPGPGRHRVFLQFRHDGRIRTVAHTLDVGA